MRVQPGGQFLPPRGSILSLSSPSAWSRKLILFAVEPRQQALRLVGDHGQRLVSGWSPGSRPSAAAIASGPVVRLVSFFRLVPRWRDVCRRWIEQRDGPAQKTRGRVGCGVPESSATISADVRTDGPPGGLLSDLARAMTAAALRATDLGW